MPISDRKYPSVPTSACTGPQTERRREKLPRDFKKIDPQCHIWKVNSKKQAVIRHVRRFQIQLKTHRGDEKEWYAGFFRFNNLSRDQQPIFEERTIQFAIGQKFAENGRHM